MSQFGKDMKRKTYISPTVEVLVVASSAMLATSPGNGNGIIVGGGDGDSVDSESQLSMRRRGTWGNLWQEHGITLTSRGMCMHIPLLVNISLLTQYYIKRHHQYKTYGKTYCSHITVLAGLRRWDKFLNHNIQHRSCSKRKECRHR